MLHHFSSSPQTSEVNGHWIHIRSGDCSLQIVDCACGSSFVCSMGAVHSGWKRGGSNSRNIVSSSGTVSTTTTSTTTTSTTTTSTSSGFHSSSIQIDRQLMLADRTTKSQVPVEINTEKEKHFDGLAQEFFGEPSANCSVNGSTIGVLESWFRELNIQWVLHLAGGAAAGELKHTFPSKNCAYAVRCWIRALTEITETSYSARLLFPDRSSQHTRFTQENMERMLPFVDVMVATTGKAFPIKWVDAYNKVEILLDVRDALSKASLKIRLPSHSTTSSAEVERIQGEMASLLSAKESMVDEAIWNTMEEIKRCILEPIERSDNSSGAQTPRVSPIIYKTTRSVIDYILFLQTNYSSLAPVLYEAASLGMIANEIDNTNPLSSLIMEMISCIEEKLIKKSQSFPDQGFRFMFLMNNYYLIQQLLHHSVCELVLESHMQTLTNKIEDYIQDYLQASWSPVLSCLCCTTTPLPFGRDSPFTKFQKEFEKTYSAQKLWPVRNPELRKKLRMAITEKVISGLKKYLVDNNISLRRVALQEIEKMLQEIFEG